MKKKYTCHTLLFILLSISAAAQVKLQNPGMELWSGNKLQRPDYWTTSEQAYGIKVNTWVFRETMPDNMHSGLNAVRLYSDTTSFLPGQSGQLVVVPGMIAYGKASYINNKLVTSGLPVFGRPVSFSMYVKISHPVTDTTVLRVMLTRWNGRTLQEDTVAYERHNIFPDSTNMSQFAFYIDTIRYLTDGLADTARVIISGGRRGNVQTQGNTTWIDDMAFNYPNDPTLRSDAEEDMALYPNPATTKVTIDANDDLFGYTLLFLDVSGILIKTVLIDDGTTSVDVSDMHDGTYSYALLDRDQRPVHEGSLNIMKSR
jgi:hypothetical protein